MGGSTGIQLNQTVVLHRWLIKYGFCAFFCPDDVLKKIQESHILTVPSISELKIRWGNSEIIFSYISMKTYVVTPL